MHKILKDRNILKRVSFSVTFFYLVALLSSLYGNIDWPIATLGIIISIIAIFIHGALFVKSIKSSSNCDGRNVDMNILSLWVMVFLITICC